VGQVSRRQCEPLLPWAGSTRCEQEERKSGVSSSFLPEKRGNPVSVHHSHLKSELTPNSNSQASADFTAGLACAPNPALTALAVSLNFANQI